jgi:hypothetical protein
MRKKEKFVMRMLAIVIEKVVSFMAVALIAINSGRVFSWNLEADEWWRRQILNLLIHVSQIRIIYTKHFK